MRRYILLLISLLALCGASAQQTATYFPYPTPPETLPFGRQRANYMVEHFWDHTPWKTAYTAPARMEQALRDFAQFLPLAATDTVNLSIEKLIKESSKKPANLESLIRMAEATFRSDTALLQSAEVYIPFVRAGAETKKLNPELRRRCEAQLKVLESSTAGKTLPAITATARDGSALLLNDTTSGAQSYVLILERPGDFNGRFERIRFTANAAARELIELGLIKPLLIAAGGADESWWTTTATLPPQWAVGQLVDAEEYFDLRENPSVYMLNPEMTVVSEWMPLENLIVNCEALIQALKSQQ